MDPLDPEVVGPRYGDSIQTQTRSGQTKSAGPVSTRGAPIAPSEITGAAECMNAAGELRTPPCCLWTDDPRHSGL